MSVPWCWWIIFDGVDGLLDQVLDGACVCAPHRDLADAQDVPLRLRPAAHPPRPSWSYTRADDVGAGVDHFPEQVFLLHDLEIVAQVGRGGHRVRQGCEVGDAADLFEQLAVLEALLEGDEVYGLAAVVHLRQGAEDGLVAQIVKDLLAGVLNFSMHRPCNRWGTAARSRALLARLRESGGATGPLS